VYRSQTKTVEALQKAVCTKHLTEEHHFLLLSVTVITMFPKTTYAYQNLTFNVLRWVAELKGLSRI